MTSHDHNGLSRVSDAVLARVIDKAKAKDVPVWTVPDPISHLGFADQASVLAQLFASGALGSKHQVALDALAQALVLHTRSPGESAAPRGLTAAACALLGAAKTAPDDAPGMFPRYSHSLDALVMWAYSLEPGPLDALADLLKGPARLGLESVRFRFGRSVPAALRAGLLEGFARTGGDSRTAWPTLVSTPDGLACADEDEIERLALRLGTEDAWTKALADAVGAARPLRGWLVRRLDPAALGRALARMSRESVTSLDGESVGALLAPAGTAQELTGALESLPDTCEVQVTLLAVAAGVKWAAAGLPIPRPWPMHRSYTDWSDEVARRLLVAGLFRIAAHMPTERAHAWAKSLIDATLPDAMVVLAAHPDKALVRRALGALDADAHPEAYGLLLAALGKPMPRVRQLRLDYLVARSQLLANETCDPRWLDALDLREEVDVSDASTVVWAESRILLAFPPARRAAVVLAALGGVHAKAHAIQLLRVLDEADAARGLAAALASPTPPPARWLDRMMRSGSLREVAAPWTRETLLARLDPPVRARYPDVVTGQPPAPAAIPESARRAAPRAPGRSALRFHGLVPAGAVAPRPGTRSCIGGRGPVAPAHVPRHGDTPMEHAVTIDLGDVPEWKARWPEAAAISVFLPDVHEHGGDFARARLVWVPEAGLRDFDGSSIAIAPIPIDGPADCFDRRDLRGSIWRLGGHAQGAPLWIHPDESPRRRKAPATFLFQINAALAGAHLNLGRDGALYAFDDGTVVFQSR